MNSPIFCLHSSGLSGSQWHRLTQALPDREVVAPDLLGYGDNPAEFATPFECEQDVARLESLLAQPSVLVGHSYGGFLALQLALKKPNLVRGLFLFDPIVWGVLASKEGLAGELVITDPRFLDPESAADDWLECFVDFWGEPGSWANIGERARTSMLDSYPKLRAEVGSLVYDRTPHTAYQRIQCPTTLLYGKRSPEPEQKAVRVLHEAIAGSELIALEGGHMAPITHFQPFLSQLEMFLSSNSL